MKSRSGLVVGAVAFLIWETLCGVICFGARSYMVQPAASAWAMLPCASALGVLVAMGLAMSMRQVDVRP